MKFNLIVTAFILLIIPNGYGQSDFKTELKKMADDITQQIKQKGNKRVAVANFTDMQNNETELGKYLALQFSNYLIRGGMDVVDRSKIDFLMEENKMTSKGLLDPATQAILGKLAGIEVIIVGATTPVNKAVELNISAIDIVRGTSFAATDGSIPRSEAINDLLRATVRPTISSAAAQNSPAVASQNGLETGYILMGDKTFEMKKGDCLDGSQYFGKVCFENSTKDPLVLYRYAGSPGWSDPNILIAPGARNCTGKIYMGQDTGSKSFSFYLKTPEEDEHQQRYGKVIVDMETCIIKVHVLNTNRLYMSKTKPTAF